jgi:hypothetical protein
MVRIEGTYTCVKTQCFVDFLINMGVDSTMASKLLGTHWSMRIWCEDNLWGCSFMCKEHPHLNSFDTMEEGVESTVYHYMFGGKAKLVFKKNSTEDGFSAICESVKFGKIVWEEKFSEEGVCFTFTGKGKSMTESWVRMGRTEGAYIFHQGENVESYFKSCGDSILIKYLDTYKIHIGKKGSTIFMSERFGDYAKCSNTIELEVETPFYIPGDKRGESPSCKVIMTRIGVGKYLMVCKTKDGLVEEWRFTFNDWGLTLNCLEKRTGQTCELLMRRFRDTSGTFKLVSTSGFEKFGKVMGVSTESINEIMNDHHTKMVILDKGNGYIRHQLIRKKHPMDYSFKLNEQFSLYHPLLKEMVRCVGTVNRYTFCMMSKTSKGSLKSLMHFNDHFMTWSVSLPESHVSCKMIFERCL